MHIIIALIEQRPLYTFAPRYNDTNDTGSNDNPDITITFPCLN